MMVDCPAGATKPGVSLLGPVRMIFNTSTRIFWFHIDFSCNLLQVVFCSSIGLFLISAFGVHLMQQVALRQKAKRDIDAARDKVIFQLSMQLVLISFVLLNLNSAGVGDRVA